jgi:hypothetical protein
VTRPREDLQVVPVAPALVAYVRRRWPVARIAAANVALTTLTVVACHLLGLG